MARKILSIFKAFSDLVIYIFFFLFFTGWITQEFYKWGAVLVLPGMLSTIIFLINKFMKKHEN